MLLSNSSTLRLRILLITIPLLFCFTFREVDAGVCWETLMANGRCKDLVQLSVTKEHCCKLAGGLAAWTEEDVDNGQAFFWSALGGGAPNCKSCLGSCETIKCPDNEVCTVRHGQPRCGCPTHCPSAHTNGSTGGNIRKLCGSDGLTYKSECHFKKHQCRNRIKDWVDYEGHCQRSCDTVHCSNPDQHCVLDRDHKPHCVRCMTRCPDAYFPVCGTDGVTYDSMCHLHKAACEQKPKKISYAYKGECNATATCSTAECAADEVCVIDNRNNIPRCVRCDLSCANSPSQPVCGSDGVTYNNWCQLRENSCSFGVLIHVDRIGSCQVSPKNARTTFLKSSAFEFLARKTTYY